MGLKDFFNRSNPQEEAASALYGQAVALARQAVFYERLEVPDSLDGRFEMICLHVFLLLRRLKQESGGEARATSQALYDAMFADMDRSLREMGVGDLGVAKRVKKMAQALSGRIAAYEAALEQEGEKPLADALKRNLYGTLPEVGAGSLSAMARYLRGQAAHLDGLAGAGLLAGEAAFAEPSKTLG